jgi:hypothetical protein
MMMTTYAHTGLRERVIEFLRHAGPRRNAEIREALSYIATPNAVNQVLYRLHRDGLVDRCGFGATGMGRYKLIETPSQTVAMMNRWLVITMLDRLFVDYPDAMDDELWRRGWRRA